MHIYYALIAKIDTSVRSFSLAENRQIKRFVSKGIVKIMCKNRSAASVG